MRNKKMRKNWQLGFFGFLAFFAIPGVLRGELIWLTWLVWVVWFTYLIPIKEGEGK